MPEPFAVLVGGLRAVGGAHPLLVGGCGAVALLWALYRWADEASARIARRAGGVAVLLLGFGLLLRVGLAVNAPPPMLAPWQWLVGLFVLPLFVRSARFGGAAAMLFFLCLAMALATAVGWVADTRAVLGLALVAGLVALAAAVVLARMVPRPEPEPVPAAALQARLDTPEANEAADKYTRE
jgi:hypothetical protein